VAPLATQAIKLALAGLVLAGAAACSPTPVSVAGQSQGQLSFRLLIDNGTSTVSGRVMSPETLLRQGTRMFTDGGSRLKETLVAGATIEVVDAEGKPREGVPAVKTDEDGRFKLRGLRIGEAGFLRASFVDAKGKTRYLYTYVRPSGEAGCSEISLPTTLIAGKIANDGFKAPLYDPDKLAPLPAKIREALPGSLQAAAGSGSSGADPLQALLDAVTIATTPSGVQVNLPEPARPDAAPGLDPLKELLDNVIKAKPEVGQDLEQAIDTFLVVTFSIQRMLDNEAVFANKQETRSMMIGQARLFYALPDAGYQGVTFWLNNDKAAEATFENGQWVARLDTRQKADGPYVLSACARAADGKLKVLTRAYVYVKNTLPEEVLENACWSETLDPAPSGADPTEK
jgi:hypothetical protein